MIKSTLAEISKFGGWGGVMEMNIRIPKGEKPWPMFPLITENKKVDDWTSLVVQWLRLRLPMQGVRV